MQSFMLALLKPVLKCMFYFNDIHMIYTNAKKKMLKRKMNATHKNNHLLPIPH